MKTAKNTTVDLLSREYKYGFVTDIEAGTVPRGLNKEIVRFDFGKEERAELHARLASEGLSAGSVG
jgi:hypothetical protein